MDIEEFYDADERRRRSPEIELGTEWRDAAEHRFELNWVQDTGELYLMREPVVHEWMDPTGGIHVRSGGHARSEGMLVEVVAHIPTRVELEAVLAGWEQHMGAPDGFTWLHHALESAGAAPPGDAPG